MAKVEYTKIEQFLIDNISNIQNIPLNKLENLAYEIEMAKQCGKEIIGVYIESSRSQITDETVYELITSEYNSSLHGDWVWINTKNMTLA